MQSQKLINPNPITHPGQVSVLASHGVWRVAGLSEAMLRGGSWQLGEKGTHYIKTIKNSSHHLANIINDILDAAAFSKGRLVIKREKASLSSFAVWAFLALQAPATKPDEPMHFHVA